MLYGHFARQIGLVQALAEVPVAMKTVVHSPGDKLAQLLAHILSGGKHISEMRVSPHCLIADQAVVAAFGQERFASSSGVSHLLSVVSAQTVASLKDKCAQVIGPYVRRTREETAGEHVTVDLDLTGLAVSDQATTYEGAQFGYLGQCKGKARGYQFAVARLVGKRDGLVLGAFLHPGNSVSMHCLRELVALVESTLGRPSRRTEAMSERLEWLRAQLERLEAQVARCTPRPQGREVWLSRQRQAVANKRHQLEELEASYHQAVEDNDHNPWPRRILLRMDGGFGGGASPGWLYEQGYDFVTRGHSHSTADGMHQEAGLVWSKISKNAWIAQSKKTTLGDCPYPVRLFAWQQKRPGHEDEHWLSVVTNPELSVKEWPPRRVGVFYNKRQVIEATIKEQKAVFSSRHLPTRHNQGIALYEQLVVLAQNLVHWFRRAFLADSPLHAVPIKHLVQIGANTRALVLCTATTVAVRFARDGPWADIDICSDRQTPYQLPLLGCFYPSQG
ncbi:MAG: transposase [Anaerolineae bacterium]